MCAYHRSVLVSQEDEIFLDMFEDEYRQTKVSLNKYWVGVQLLQRRIDWFNGEYHGTAHALAVENVTVYKPIGSDVIIRA